MASFVLIPGAGSDSWYWHLVAPELEARGHEVLAVDLPCDDDDAGFAEYADAVVEAAGDWRDRDDLVVVAQSLAGFVAPLVCGRLPVRLLVLVAAMVPRPGESGGDWWAATGQAEAMRGFAEEEGRSRGDGRDEAEEMAEIFVHDVPDDVAAESLKHVRPQSGAVFEKPWPLDAWPDVPTRFLLCRHDRLFPAAFQRRVVRERLGIEPDEMDGGHLPALARPLELADRLDLYSWDLPTG